MSGLLRTITVHALLLAVSLPALLGVGMHWGQTHCCHHAACDAIGPSPQFTQPQRVERSSRTCGHDCPWDHSISMVTGNRADASLQNGESCRICDYLALAKQNCPEATRLDTADDVSIDLFFWDELSLPRTVFHAVSARGPPSQA